MPTDAEIRARYEARPDLAEIRKRQPRPLHKLYGKNPTPEQIAESKADWSRYNSELRRATKEYRAAVEGMNELIRRQGGIFGLGINNISIEAIARDADRDAKYAEESGDIDRAQRLRAQAAEIRAEKSNYRHTGTQKRFANGKIKKYTNLGIFNAECSKHGSSFAAKAMICELRTVKCLSDGSGMATVDVRGWPGSKKPNSRTGTWRLHFASCKVMKDHLKGRVGALEGQRKRR